MFPGFFTNVMCCNQVTWSMIVAHESAAAAEPCAHHVHAELESLCTQCMHLLHLGCSCVFSSSHNDHVVLIGNFCHARVSLLVCCNSELWQCNMVYNSCTGHHSLDDRLRSQVVRHIVLHLLRNNELYTYVEGAQASIVDRLLQACLNSHFGY